MTEERKRGGIIAIAYFQIFMAIFCILLTTSLANMLKTVIANRDAGAFAIGGAFIVSILLAIYFFISGIYFLKLTLMGWTIIFYQFVPIFIFSILIAINAFNKMFKSSQNLIIELKNVIIILPFTFISFIIILYLVRIKEKFR